MPATLLLILNETQLYLWGFCGSYKILVYNKYSIAINKILRWVKSCNILLMWGSIQQLWMLLLSWRWSVWCWALLIISVLLAGFASMAWSTVTESMVLGSAYLAWSLRFFQPELNFLNSLVTILWSTAPSPFTALWPSSNLSSVSFQIQLHRMFICESFQLHM